MSFTPYPTQHKTEVVSILEGPKLVTYIGRTLPHGLEPLGEEPSIAATLDIGGAKHRVIVRPGLFVPAKGKLSFAESSYVVSYEVRT